MQLLVWIFCFVIDTSFAGDHKPGVPTEVKKTERTTKAEAENLEEVPKEVSESLGQIIGEMEQGLFPSRIHYRTGETESSMAAP